ncbi:L,D-transpeptidase family protein [Streptomyces sp. NPDC060205]|uniref:L,D-transpeptidase family protein n=1 Tax=Streptomyces sp. NPDC060205 TaxID=3347072 RepID=UPI00364DD486
MITSTRGAGRRSAVVLAATLLLAVLAVLAVLAGCGGPETRTTARVPGAHETRAGGAAPAPAPRISLDAAPRHLPSLGPKTSAGIPPRTSQVLVVTGRGRNSAVSTAVLYKRTASGWHAGTLWPAHNAFRGWTDRHVIGDLRSPVGVYTLTDAGGLRGDPGTRLPYHHSGGFFVDGTGFEGEALAGSFDHVIAIDYNREPGTSPLDWTRPLGVGRGGGIWVHVDHGGPTQGCVSLREDHMKALLRAVDPARHPVIVMGDAAALRR